MTKRFISFVLASMLILSFAVPVLAGIPGENDLGNGYPIYFPDDGNTVDNAEYEPNGPSVGPPAMSDEDTPEAPPPDDPSVLLELKSILAKGSKTDVLIRVDDVPVSSDVPAYIDGNSRTMVPIRFISEALGAKVDWQQDTRTVIIDFKDRHITLKIGEKKANINNETVSLDTNAVLKDSRTFVPLRFISENLGYRVDWVQNLYRADIYSQTAEAE